MEGKASAQLLPSHTKESGSTSVSAPPWSMLNRNHELRLRICYNGPGMSGPFIKREVQEVIDSWKDGRWVQGYRIPVLFLEIVSVRGESWFGRVHEA